MYPSSTLYTRLTETFPSSAQNYQRIRERYFQENPDILSNQLYAYAQALAEQYGWEFGGPIAGHLIGQFPHERIAEDKVTLYVHPGSRLRMRSVDEKGQKRHWILEIHFVNKEREIGGFYEELLTVG